MKIGLLLPSLLMTQRYHERIFAPKPLFLDLANGLVDKGHQVYVYSAPHLDTKAELVSGDDILSKTDLPSVRVRDEEHSGELQYRLNAFEYEADLTLSAYLHACKHQLDVMHVYLGNYAHYLSPLANIPTVFTLHDPVFNLATLDGWRFNRFQKHNYVAISQRQKQIFSSHEIHIVDVVYHGIDIATFPFCTDRGEYLAFVGRIIPEKGVEDAIFVAKHTKIPVHIATSENYLNTPYYQQKILPMLDKDITWLTGYLHKKERDEWMKKARALLFPVKWEEPFGMVMVEAMACGTPVIAYNQGSVPEIVKDGVTGFIVQPAGPAARQPQNQPTKGHPAFGAPRLASPAGEESPWVIKQSGITGLVEAVQRIGEIDRRACRKHVEENFTVDEMVEGYERIYRKIINNQIPNPKQ